MKWADLRDREEEIITFWPSLIFLKTQCSQASILPNIPTVGQVEGYAPLDVSSKLQVPQTRQADVEDSDDSHSHIEDERELPRILHFVFKGQNLGE